MNNHQDKKSSATMRRRLRPEERKVELLEAALQVLRKLGTNARVEDVTKAAGTAKGTFYLYFPSWEELLLQVRQHIVSNYALEKGERFAHEAPAGWWSAFEEECLHFIDFLEDLGEAHNAVFHGPIEDQPPGSASPAERFIAGMLKTGIGLGACREVETDMAARLLFAVLHSTSDHIAQTGNRQGCLDSMLDLLRNWLRAPGFTDEEEPES